MNSVSPWWIFVSFVVNAFCWSHYWSLMDSASSRRRRLTFIALTQAQGISEPWTQPSFIDSVADLQRRRQLRASCGPDGIQFHDRSAVCTAALLSILGIQSPTHLRAN
jgi:predicted ATPase